MSVWGLKIITNSKKIKGGKVINVKVISQFSFFEITKSIPFQNYGQVYSVLRHCLIDINTFTTWTNFGKT